MLRARPLVLAALSASAACAAGGSTCPPGSHYRAGLCAHDGDAAPPAPSTRPDASSAACPPQALFRDADGDGRGDRSAPLPACADPSGYVASDDDCDDASALAHPGAPERCNGRDDDCDGFADEQLAAPLGAPVRVAEVDPWIHTLAVAPTREGYALAWVAPGGRVLWQLVDAEGASLSGAPAEIDETPGFQDRPDVVVLEDDGREVALIGWQASASLYARAVPLALLAPLPRQRIDTAGHAAGPALAVVDGRVAAAWLSLGATTSLLLRLLEADGTPASDEAVVHRYGAGPDKYAPALAALATEPPVLYVGVTDQSAYGEPYLAQLVRLDVRPTLAVHRTGFGLPVPGDAAHLALGASGEGARARLVAAVTSIEDSVPRTRIFTVTPGPDGPTASAQPETGRGAVIAMSPAPDAVDLLEAEGDWLHSTSLRRFEVRPGAAARGPVSPLLTAPLVWADVARRGAAEGVVALVAIPEGGRGPAPLWLQQLACHPE